MSYRRYPAYRDSGVEWIGELPSGWAVGATSRVFKIVSGSTPKSGSDEFWNGDVEWITPAEMGKGGAEIIASRRTLTFAGLNSCGAELVPKGSVVLSTRAPIGAVNLAGVSLATNQGCKSLVPTRELDTRFYYFYFLIADKLLNNLGRGTTFLELGTDQLKSFKIPLPPLAEQKQIAAFLDRECGRMDALQAKQERLIELLKEKRQAQISHAVTRGLTAAQYQRQGHTPDWANSDPTRNTPEMKDSGVEWIGVSPSHWKILPVKRFFRLSCVPSQVGHELELLSLYTEIGVRPRKSLEQKGNKASNTDGYWLVEKNDLVVNKLLAWMGAVGISEYDGVTSPAYDILKGTRDVDGWFYHHLFRTKTAQREFKRWSRGIMEMRLRLYFDELGQIFAPLPPLPEQNAIVAHLDETCTKIDTLIDRAESAIALLKERRTALISAAVTGKIDVREEV